MIKVLFIGDIVGAPGRKALQNRLPILKNKYNPHFIIANGENAAAGKGITPIIARQFYEMGIHGITMGNHTWAQKDIFDIIDTEQRLIRPANFPVGSPGKGYATLQVNGKELVMINIQGRTFLNPIDCPFTAVDHILNMVNKKTPVLVDFHAEATSEKVAMGWYLDGRVAAVLGTHTHVQTNDDRILPQGTAYITDVGMVGSRDGILGISKDAVFQKFLYQMPARFTVDEGRWHFHAVYIEMEEESGLSHRIQKIRFDEDDQLME